MDEMKDQTLPDCADYLAVEIAAYIENELRVENELRLDASIAKKLRDDLQFRVLIGNCLAKLLLP